MKNPYLALWLKQNTELVKVGKGWAIRFKPQSKGVVYFGARRHGRNSLLKRLVRSLWYRKKES